jgi:hypothetical protein
MTTERQLKRSARRLVELLSQNSSASNKETLKEVRIVDARAEV